MKTSLLGTSSKQLELHRLRDRRETPLTWHRVQASVGPQSVGQGHRARVTAANMSVSRASMRESERGKRECVCVV